jgi:hypothetical protein
MRRTERLIIPTTVNEKKQIDKAAKEVKLNMTDYVRSRLGITLARGKRNNYEKAPELPPGDPENAVDVEELAKELFDNSQYRGGSLAIVTMNQARKEAKRRLELAVAER